MIKRWIKIYKLKKEIKRLDRTLHILFNKKSNQDTNSSINIITNKITQLEVELERLKR